MRIEITKQILESLLEIERFLACIPTSEQYKSFLTNQRRKTLIQDLEALSLSYELSFTERELKRIYSGQEVNIQQHPSRAIRNAISAMRYLETQKDSPFNLGTIQHINKLLGDGYVEFWEEGKIRQPNEQPSLNNDGLRNRPNNFQAELFNQIKYINATDELGNSLLRGIIFLYYFLLSYPFSSFNLQTALLCFYAIVKDSPYNAKGLVPVLSIAYSSLMKQDFEGKDRNLEENLKSLAANILHAYTNFTEQILISMEQRETIPDDLLSSLNERQVKALGILKRKRKLSRRKYALMNNIGIATAFRDLKDMVDKGLTVCIGNGRGTYYMLADMKKTGGDKSEKPEISAPQVEIYEELHSIEELQ